MSKIPPRALSSFLCGNSTAILVVSLILAGVLLRVDWMNRTRLWCDEAESGINALTILDRGFPLDEYLGIPVFENTLTEPWDGSREYEFRDSSYSPRGLAVYHGWLPLYAIAASQALFGLRADHPGDPPAVLHGTGDIALRTTAPRIPAIVFSALCMLAIFLLARELGGPSAGFAALTLMAFNAKTVDFGYQARYYSLTLLMTAFAALCLLRMVRCGRWRDYLLLGFAEALLFHTHQLSAVIFAGVALVTIPAAIRRRDWFIKALGAGALCAVLVVPWIWFSGFLFTASDVPKAYKLFDSPADWLTYTSARPNQLALLAGLVLALLIGKLRPAWLPARFHEAARENGAVYLALFAWLVTAYAVFHMLVPAASFFYERLSLVLWTPYVLVLAMLTSDLLRGASPRWSPVLAIVAMSGFLAARGRLAFFETPSLPGSRQEIAVVIGALEKMRFENGTRLYASPNEHLLYTYYTGLPVQSVAPVRKSFFASCKNPLVFIESQMDWMFPDDQDVRFAAATAGIPLSPARTEELRDLVWMKIVAEELAKEGIPAPPHPPLPEFLDPVVGKTRLAMLESREQFLDDIRSSPIFRGVSATRLKDFWLGFFYRFVDPGERIGKNLNILPRLQNAEVGFLPDANVVIYRTDP
ncbi:MAG: glycosyltransferase family 39 protein [Terrimicrobiaceae bacterium]